MAKELSITELRDEKLQVEKRAKELIALARKEERKLTSEEDKQINNDYLRITEINLDIAARKAHNEGEGRKHQMSAPVSLRKAILEVAGYAPISEETTRMSELGAQALHKMSPTGNLFIPTEARAFTATGSDTGKSMIETKFLDILAPLRDRMVLGEAGATFMTGLVGNIDIPSFSGSTANWAGEDEDSTDGGGTFSHATMKPKRLTSKLTVSKQLLLQDSLGVEAMLRADLVASIADALEKALLGNHSHSDDKPDGLFTGLAKTGKAFTWDEVVDLETSVDAANMGDTGNYIMHTVLRGAAKKTVKKSAGALGFILEPNGEMNGYGALRTNSIASGEDTGPGTPDIYGMIFGNWAEYLVGQWGALDLLIDPYTKASKAYVNIYVNSWWDALPRREAAFAKGYFKL